MIRRPPRSTQSRSSAASDVYKRQKVESDQDIICERSMYWDARRGGHDSIGVTSPGKTWYLAEGSTAWGFTTWLLLQNPAEDKSAKVNVTYMTKFGPVYESDFK